MQWNIPLVPEQASELAGRVDAVMLMMLGISIFFTVLIAGQVIVYAIRYRAGNRADRRGRKSSDTRLELFWIGGALLLCIAMYIPATHVYFQLYDPPADSTEISVVGKQWMWYAQHPEGRRETNELHVPLGRPIKLVMTSQDVIHSFFIPAFRIKQDVLPGRYTSLWFRPTKVGRYHLFCAEYCGAKHSGMVGSVYVMEPSDYEQWLAGSRGGGGGAATMAVAGSQLFQQHHCAGCHGESGQGGRGPSLVGLFGGNVPIQQGDSTRMVKADETYLRESIVAPQAKLVAGYDPIMPSYQGQISEPDLLQIISYIKALGRSREERK